MRQYVWGYNPSKNILSTENLRRVSDALKAGPVFGYTYRTHSGGGPGYWLARDWAEFERVIEDRPVSDAHLDYTVMWSLPALLERGMALAASRYDDLAPGTTSLFTPENMRAIVAGLAGPWRESWALFFGTDRGPEVGPNDFDPLETITEYAEWYCEPGGEGYVFPYTSSQERDADGLLTDTIERPEYWLLDGWYPDALGRVPTDIEYA